MLVLVEAGAGAGTVCLRYSDMIVVDAYESGLGDRCFRPLLSHAMFSP